MIIDGQKIYEYMIAICPEGATLDQVMGLKQRLYENIGDHFKSRRSLAHITIHEFDLNEWAIEEYKKLLRAFAPRCSAVTLSFNGIAWFDNNKTIYVQPDDKSTQWMLSFAASYFKSVPRKSQVKFTPHMTVGRQINPAFFEKAKETFSKIPIAMSYLCDNITLRKYNRERRQYDIVERFYFGGNAMPEIY